VLGELRRELAGRLPIEAHGFQFRTQAVQSLEIVRGRLADGGIEAAFAFTGGQHVPQAEAVRQQARQALGVRQRIQVFADEGADQLLDLFSRQLVGWSMSSRIDRELAMNVLLMAVWRRQPKNTVVVHSDQGSQFSSYNWRDFLHAHNL
jgi:transposase InsO family protein